MKLSTLTILFVLSYFTIGDRIDEVMTASDKPDLEIAPDRFASQAFFVYPNPFRQKFLIARIQSKTFVRDVSLLDDRGDAIEIIYYPLRGRISVYVPDAPAGAYTVVVTYGDGTSDTMPITKL